MTNKLPTREWVVEVTGFQSIWGTSPTAPSVLPGGRTSGNYLGCIVGISDFVAKYVENAPLCDVSPIQVDFAGGVGLTAAQRVNDPFILTRAFAPVLGNLTQRVDLLGLDEVKINRDLSTSGLSYPLTIHIGNESMTATGFRGISRDPGAAIDPMDPVNTGPYRLVISARALLGTYRNHHEVSTSALDQPRVTWGPTPGAFANRRVILYLDGNPVFRGVLSRGAGGVDQNTVSLEMLPLTSMFDQEVEKSLLTTTLAPNAHYFDRTQYWEYSEVMFSGALYALPLVAPTSSATDLFELDATDITDPTAYVAGVVDLTRPPNCPRRGSVRAFNSDRGVEKLVLDTITGTPDNEIEVVNDGRAWVSDNLTFMNQFVWELKQVEFSPGLYTQWSSAFQNTLEGLSASVSGDDGRWFSPEFLIGGGLNALRFTGVPSVVKFGSRQPTIFLWGSFDSAREAAREIAGNLGQFGVGELQCFRYVGGELVNPSPLRDTLWFPLDFAAPESTVFIDGENFATGAERFGWNRQVPVPDAAAYNTPSVTFPVRGFATSWYQNGDRYVLVSPPVLFQGDHDVTWVVDTFNRAANSREQFTIRTNQTTAEGEFFKLRLVPGQGVKSFGDFLGYNGGATTLTAASIPGLFSARDLLLGVLCSRGPDEGSLNVRFAQGLGLAYADLNLNDFNDLEIPGFFDFSQIFKEEGLTWEEILTPILSATNRTLAPDHRWPAGQGVLRLPSVVPPLLGQGLGATPSVLASDLVWGTDPQREFVWDFKNSFTFLTNYDSEDEPQITTVFVDAGDASARKTKQDVELELRGLFLSPDPALARAELVPLASSVLLSNGPRTRLGLDLNWTKVSRQLHVGGECLVPAWFIDYNPTDRDQLIPIRITGVTFSAWDATAHVDGVAYGGNPNLRGWSPSARFTGILDEDGDAVTGVALTSVYSPHDDATPGSANDLFAPGVIWQVCARGAHEGSTNGTVATYSAGTLTFTAPNAALLAAYAAAGGGTGPKAVDGWLFARNPVNGYWSQWGAQADPNSLEVATGIPGTIIG
jgi:hypothetical protein